MIAGTLLAMAMQLLPAPGLPRWRAAHHTAQADYAIGPAPPNARIRNQLCAARRR